MKQFFAWILLSIRSVLVLMLCLGLGYLSLSYRLGGVTPGDFIDYYPEKLPEEWQTAHSGSWLKLSESALAAQDYSHAKSYALKASCGASVLVRLDLGNCWAHKACHTRDMKAVPKPHAVDFAKYEKLVDAIRAVQQKCCGCDAGIWFHLEHVE